MDITETFPIGLVAVCLCNLERSCSYVQTLLEPPPDNVPTERLLQESGPQFEAALHDLNEACQADGIALSAPVAGQMARVRALIAQRNQMKLTTRDYFKHLDEQVRALRLALIDDLNSHWFRHVPSADAPLMASADHFGEKVAERVPDAQDDIRSAARCLALREGTAAVFHLMRVLEHGLHEIARNLNVTMAATIELENWQNIIDQIERKIREESAALAQLKRRGPLPQDKLNADARLQALNSIAKEFSYFKDAWRNHVSHCRATYDPDQARSVWNHVREFMQKVAAVV